MAEAPAHCALPAQIECPQAWALARPVTVFARRLLPLTSVAVLLLGPPIARSLEGKAIWWFCWQPGDAAWLVALMLLGCIAALAVRAAVRRVCSAGLSRAFDHLFIVGLGAGLLTNLSFYSAGHSGWRFGQFSAEMQLAWLLLVAVAAWSAGRPDSQVLIRCRQLAEIISPAALLLIVQLFRAPTLPRTMDPLPRPSRGAITGLRVLPPVHLFIFDEWSYQRTFEAGQVRPNLPNLAALARECTVYHSAKSPGIETAQSVPGILRSSSGSSTISGGVAGFAVGNRFVPAESCPSLFDAVEGLGYQRVLGHFGYALNLWAEGKVDCCRSYLWYPRPRSPAEHLLLPLHDAAFYWTDPITPTLHLKLKTRINDAAVLETHRGLTADSLALVTRPDPVFSVLHWPLPHHPYLLNPDGSYRGAASAAWEKGNLEGYQRNLAVLDAKIGELVAAMKAAGTWNNSLLVLTSDHGWRNDPARQPGDDLRHVPLMVKLPGHTEPRQVDADIELSRLGELIASIVQPPAASTRPAGSGQARLD